jgi:hypothetical protein
MKRTLKVKQEQKPNRHVQQQLARLKADSSTTFFAMAPLVAQLGPQTLARQAVAAVADLLAPEAAPAAAAALVSLTVLREAKGLPAAAAQVGTLSHSYPLHVQAMLARLVSWCHLLTRTSSTLCVLSVCVNPDEQKASTW